MELIEKIRKNKTTLHIAMIPNAHLAALSALCVLLIVVAALPSQNAQASKQPVLRHTTTLALPESLLNSDVSDDIDRSTARTSPIVAKHIANHAPVRSLPLKTATKRLVVAPGDTLSHLFSKAGLSDRHMMNFLANADESKRLASLKPGNDVIFELIKSTDATYPVASLTYVRNKLHRYRFAQTTASAAPRKIHYAFSDIQRTPDIKYASRSGVITTSLYSAGLASGMDENLIMKLAEIFGWDIDFALDIRKGDRFRILFEERFLDGEKLGNGDILSAEFINQDQSFKAVRYLAEDGRKEYYTPDGKNLRKAFLRAPVDFRRISDGFNPRRLHPITKTIRPHRGIDYAARTGTPIWSAGDGKVLRSGYSKYNGNYVVIQHGNNIQTKYLHLHKRHVKKGQRVRQKQVIGTVGTTGLSNGPHLHYEFLLNGVHRNPRTILNKLPKAESIPSEVKAKFVQQATLLIAELDKDTGTMTALALDDTEPRNTAL